MLLEYTIPSITGTLALIVAGVNPFAKSADFKDAVYGAGMFISGLSHIKSAFQAGWDVYKYNRPASGNSGTLVLTIQQPGKRVQRD